MVQICKKYNNYRAPFLTKAGKINYPIPENILKKYP